MKTLETTSRSKCLTVPRRYRVVDNHSIGWHAIPLLCFLELLSRQSTSSLETFILADHKFE